MKRAWKLDDDAVAYWRAYEDFRGFVTEPVWDLVRELAVDGAQQAVLRTTLHHWLLIYAEHAPRVERDRRRPLPAARRRLAAARRVLPGRRRADARGDGARSWARSASALDAPAGDRLRAPDLGQGVARRGQGAGARLHPSRRHAEHRRPAVAPDRRRAPSAPSHRRSPPSRAATSPATTWRSGPTSPSGPSASRARSSSAGRRRPRRSRARYVTSWFLVHCPPEEAIAAFHLGPPPTRARAHGQGGARPRSGRRRRRGTASSRSRRAGHPLTAPSSGSASTPTWPTTSSACTARSSRSSRTRAGSTSRRWCARARSAGASSAPTSRRSSPSAGRTRACCAA